MAVVIPFLHRPTPIVPPHNNTYGDELDDPLSLTEPRGEVSTTWVARAPISGKPRRHHLCMSIWWTDDTKSRSMMHAPSSHNFQYKQF
jgi:hypothetical protein